MNAYSVKGIAITLLYLVYSTFSLASDLPRVDSETGLIERPKERPILKIQGEIKITSDEKAAYFDYEQLKQFKQHSVVIKEPWFDTPRLQSGPLLSDVLKFLNASGETIQAIALNNYASTIPVKDLEKYPVILAIDKDGSPMRIREMGPIFITYPFDAFPELHDEVYYTRSVWQVKQLTIE